MPIGTDFMAPVLQNQEYAQREQMAPAELAHTLATTRYTTAMADRLETETAGQKKVAAAMAHMAGVPPQMGGAGSVSEQLSGMASMYASAGLPDKAAEYMSKASQAQAHEATARAAAARQAAAEIKMKGDQLKQASALLSGVKDQESWNEANRLFEEQTGQESPFKNILYDPQVVKMLNDAAMTGYQKQQLALRQTEVAMTIADKKSAIESRATRDSVALERLRVSQQREQRIAKAGGKDIGAPGKSEVQQASRLLGDTGLEGDELDNAAFSIASDAKALRRKNPALSADESLRQAALTAKSNGSIVPGEKHLLSKNVPAKFSPPVGGIKPLPTSGAKKDLVEGHLYVNPKDGKAYQWTAKGWVTPTAAGKLSVPSRSSSDGEDPDGEDDE